MDVGAFVGVGFFVGGLWLGAILGIAFGFRFGQRVADAEWVAGTREDEE